jgi:hypothetical protein
MPLTIPDNNTNTGNSKKLYVLASGDNEFKGDVDILGNLIVDGVSYLQGGAVGGTEASPNILTVPRGLLFTPQVYTATFNYTTALTQAPATFVPALPAPSAQSAGVYSMSGIISYVTILGAPVRYLISGTFINNGTFWLGAANVPLNPTLIMTVYTPSNFALNPLGTPLFVDAFAPPSPAACILNIYKISNIVGITN